MRDAEYIMINFLSQWVKREKQYAEMQNALRM